MKKLKPFFRLVLPFLGILLLFANNANSQTYCVPPSFITGPYTGITNVTLETLNNTSAYNVGVYYYSSVTPPELDKNATYLISITTADYAGMGQNVRVWIDWNRDFDFDDTLELVSMWNNQAAGVLTDSITIPLIANLDTTRMRVYADMPESGGHITPVPCGYLDTPGHSIGMHGEVEDYDIIITPGSGLNAYFTADSTSIKEGQTVNFTDQSSGAVTSWAWSFEGGTPATSTIQNPTNITYSTAGSYTVSLIVSDATTSDTLSKTDYITVSGSSGILPKMNINQFKIYPNPASDFIVLTAGIIKPSIISVSVKNILGKEVIQFNEEIGLNFSKKISTKHLTPGIYFLQWQGGSINHIQKIIVQ